MNTWTRRLTYGFGISMALLMVLSLFLPALAPDQLQTVEIPPTDPPPVPTFPPPLENFDTISFSEEYLDTSGVVAVAVPTGWEVVPNPGNAGPLGGVNLSMYNADRESTIQVLVNEPAQGQTLATTQDVSNYLTDSLLGTSWTGTRFIAGSEVLLREVRQDDVVIEFSLQDSQRREYFARQKSWTDGQWIYSTRVTVPRNATDLLDFMLDPVSDSVKPQAQFQDLPLNTWRGFYDGVNRHVLRYPAGWQLTDGGEGVPASFSAGDGTVVRVETYAGQAVADDAAAQAWVEGLRGGFNAESVATLARDTGTAYAVGYSYTTPDGEAHTGYAVLINDEDGNLHAANALLPGGGADLNTEEGQATFSDVYNALNSFTLVSGLNLPMPVVEAEATPEAVIEPEETEAAAEEATPEATENAAEATPEATEASE